ncbi:MAG TPA: dockerin type I repeat-containing protein [Planctomycetota bacterium]|nr:dockerin type I repeat-containing protein [Planctomycetota bacterium]
MAIANRLHTLTAIAVWLVFRTTSAQVIEEFPAAVGPPGFGEQPWVSGNLIMWQRYGVKEPWGRVDTIQLRDIAHLGGGIMDVVKYPANRAGIFLSGEYLFFGSGNGFPRGSPIVAQSIEAFLNGSAAEIPVADIGAVIAATKDWIFIQTWDVQDEVRRKYFAKPMTTLGDPSSETLRLVTAYSNATFIGRSEAASDEFFVWQDRTESNGWRIYARAVEDLFTEGSEREIIETKMGAVYLALHGSLLVFQAAETPADESPTGIYLVDLNRDDPPEVVVRSTDPRTVLNWPSISEYYVVWTEVFGFFTRTPYARSLVNGRLSGSAFALAETGGSWITIDRNIAAWNGGTRINEGEVSHQAIIAVELELPGAEDTGDVDQDGDIDLTDAVAVLNYLFRSGPQPRVRVSDADSDGEVGLADAVRILEYLFGGGRRPGR